eukprot:gene9325-5091_t
MDSATLANAVDFALSRLDHAPPGAATKVPRDRGLIAAQLSVLLQQYADGVTDAILLGSLQAAPAQSAAASPGLVSSILARRWVSPTEPLEFVISSASQTCFELVDAPASPRGTDAPASPGGPTLKHVPDVRLSALAGQALASPGRLIRAIGCAVGELGAGGGSLRLLPAPLVTLSLRPATSAADRAFVDDALARRRARGESALAAGALALRVSRVSDTELHHGRRLRRVLLTQPATLSGHQPASFEYLASPPEPGETSFAEVEAELLLWDADLPLIELLPPDALLCVHMPQLLSVGDAAPGGAPAQLGMGSSLVLHLEPHALTAAAGLPPSGAAQVELRVWPQGGADAPRLARSLRPGHHMLLSGLEPARVYNLSCMRAPLRTPRLHSLVPLGSGL